MGKLKNIDKGFLEYYLSSDTEEVNATLSGFGVDIAESDARKEKLVKQLKFKLKASIGKETTNNRLEKAVSLYRNALKSGLEKPIAYMNQLISQNKMAVQYKNLGKLSEEEITEIIKDQNLIEILELLEKEEQQGKE